ncbi:MFS transporter [Burkholderia sp. 22PA0106]|uniref:MFS transporter n=1 Tax=Burkholderia sp. 22PA0106 TaxID=3237371 RepID=UPI0039C35F16
MPRRRYWIAALLFGLSTINYMDRIALSIAAKPIAREFHLNSVSMGYLFSSFIWSYALFLLPLGLMIDKFGTKKMAGWGILVWSAATALTGMVSSFGGLMVARLVMGAGESVSNPVAAKVIRQWMPASERGMTTAMFASGSYAGPAICSLFLGTLIGAFGWRVSFIIAGAIGFVWLALWYVFFNTPEKVTWLSTEEQNKILSERDSVQPGAVGEQQAFGLATLLKSPTMWALAVTQGCQVYTQYLLLTWLPSYLETTRHLSLTHTGLFSSLPYAVSVILCMLAGRLSDRHLKHSGVATGRRRNAVALALLVGASILAVPFTSNLIVLMVIFAATLTGISSTASLNIALLSDLLPSSRDVAKAIAMLIIGGQVFGMIAPIATGYVVNATGSYNWAFGIAGILLVTGATVVLTLTHKPIAPPPNLSGPSHG